MNVLNRLRAAFGAVTPEGGDPQVFRGAVRATADPKFGDYQANGCMALAKSLQKNPRELAAAVREAVDLEPTAGKPEIAGPGFLNIRLHDEWIAVQLADLANDPAIGLTPPESPRTVVVDFSSPNVAKPMHVGHIRSTVIGDALARIFEALGHKVVRDNHLGDWGSQFGMILWGWKTARDDSAFAADPVAELARLYRLAQSRIKAGDKDVEDAARAETARLHAGDPENRELWTRFMPHCLKALQTIYDRLGVRFDVELGESFYDPMLAEVVADLERKGLAEESEGATVAFVAGMKAPFIIRKRDGAYNYGTTDLATIRYRAQTWNPEQILYVVDHRQGDHFKQLFDVARRWGYDQVDLEHVAFGTILGADRKPFKTRDGDVVGLESLLDEAVAEARKIVDANSPNLDPEERARIAEIVGLGAIKYADLSQNRLSDYVFDWSKMLAMNGNTATYLQYAYARIQSIFRRGEIRPEQIRERRPPLLVSHPAERALGILLLRLPETLELAALELKPNILTDYLFVLASAYSTFFEECPVLKAESAERRDSRLALSDLTARTLRFGLGLLGIDVVDQM
ncbi:arginine--tRNA ligase [Planctomyces sp. SH-PL62]|uniref:arginine--tRNA ligase n=1 Tax=Planctomyces sp. SH-PL62 TaxID=1636152 RepID=UPI00078D1739|nr:arginine--tRNA ligase [Planctomyces sp. SH-PL62]AMV39711.1 Arginine--tRNA ligase [Planctomyces sp. SH-PL62]